MPTRIPYLDELWNPITGCSGSGCATRKECWARGMVNRFPEIHGVEMGIGGSRHKSEPLYPERVPFREVRFHPDLLDQPLHWKKPRRIGVCFMGDWLDGQVKRDWIDQMIGIINQCPQHQFFFLTKQPQNYYDVISEFSTNGLLSNCWHGVSCCNPDDFDRMVPDLLRVPGKKWISFEPMMERIKIPPTLRGIAMMKHTDWIVVGCHSNPRKHPCPVEWITSVVEQCDGAGVPVFVKQLDIGGKCVRDPAQFPAHLRRREMP